MFIALLLTIAIPSMPADILRPLQDAVIAAMPEFRLQYVDYRAVLEALSPENALVVTSIEEFRERVRLSVR